MSNSSHQLVELPRDGGDPSSAMLVATRYRDFRLHALKTSPEAFASTYEIEVQRGIDHYLYRLSTPKASHIIAVKPQPPATHHLEWAWEGMIVLLGPEDGPPTAQVSARSDPFKKIVGHVGEIVSEKLSEPADTLHYHLNGVFVDLPARGTGLGKRLVERALNIALKDCEQRGASSLHCTVLVDSENAAARRLYEKVGFKAVGSESYTQQSRALADAEKEDEERIAIQMDLSRDLAEGLYT